jgi:hypothetical protein
MLPLVGVLAPLLGTVIDRIIPDKAEAEKIKMEIQAQAATAEVELQKAQIELAKEDAKTGFGGYRWAAGWLCVISLGYAWIIRDLIAWGLLLAGSEAPPPPVFDSALQYSMLMGMLGLAGVRSHDLLKGSRK